MKELERLMNIVFVHAVGPKEISSMMCAYKDRSLSLLPCTRTHTQTRGQTRPDEPFLPQALSKNGHGLGMRRRVDIRTVSTSNMILDDGKLALVLVTVTVESQGSFILCNILVGLRVSERSAGAY